MDQLHPGMVFSARKRIEGSHTANNVAEHSSFLLRKRSAGMKRIWEPKFYCSGYRFSVIVKKRGT